MGPSFLFCEQAEFSLQNKQQKRKLRRRPCAGGEGSSPPPPRVPRLRRRPCLLPGPTLAGGEGPGPWEHSERPYRVGERVPPGAVLGGSLGRVASGQFLEVWWGCGRPPPPGQARGPQLPRGPRVTAPTGWVPLVSARAPPGGSLAQTWPPVAAWERAPTRARVCPTQHTLPAFSPVSRGSLTVRNKTLVSGMLESMGGWLHVPLLLPTLGLGAGGTGCAPRTDPPEPWALPSGPGWACLRRGLSGIHRVRGPTPG